MVVLPQLLFGAERTPIAVPETGSITPLTIAERQAMERAHIYQAVKGLNNVEARQLQAEGFREILDYSGSTDFAESLAWTGPIEGMAPGMRLEEQADVYYAIVEAKLQSLSIVELEAFRDELAGGIYTLRDIQRKIEFGPATIQPDELDYLIARTLIFRERLLTELTRKQKEALR